MIQAVLAGRKTQTRRIVRPPKCATLFGRESFLELCHADSSFNPKREYLHWAYGGGDYAPFDVLKERVYCPYGDPGERLWVKETWQPIWTSKKRRPKHFKTPSEWTIHYVATGGRREYREGGKLVRRCRPAIFMPRWASRLTLTIERVRVERLQSVTEADALAEGVESWAKIRGSIADDQTLTSGERMLDSPFRASFAVLWDSINETRATWKSNPWVWVVEFRRLHPTARTAKARG